HNQAAFIIVIRGDGERTIVWHRSEELTLDPGELDREAVISGRVLLVDGQNHEASIEAARWARKAGIPVVLDAESTKEGTLDLVRLTDILISDREFPEKLLGGTDREAALREILAMGPAVACATLGEEGSFAVTKERSIHTRAFGIDCVDTTGAGDIFHAGFVYGMLRGWDLDRILLFANATAGASCEGLGGRSVLLSPDEVAERFLAGRT
ncbi:carbohydrate kinase family protein, partial [Thermodesulfobacteriota bacterium]